MTDTPIRLRFAPSPTGSLHIGGLRQALFNWLFTRAKDGKHILRIEDTDQERYVEDAVDGILRGCEWVGVTFDEGPHIGGDYGPYVQSERLEHYQKWAHWLVENDKAYKAFETSEELAKINDERKKMGLPPGYDGRARNLTDEEVAALEAEGRPYVIRFKMPREGKTVAEDLLRGKVEFENDKLNDPVLLKSDGFPTYHLAVIVDDHLMEISHVTRGVEWLASLPIHWNLWEAFGWEKPVYVHMPLILNPNGKGKLSKRKTVSEDGENIPTLVDDFIEQGYLPEATVNFLTNVGWNFGDNQEVFTVEETIERFELEDINPANSAYPLEKLDWLNGTYIREELTTDELAERAAPFFKREGYTVDMDLMKQVTPIIQTRIKTLQEAVDIAGFFFDDWDEFTAPDAEQIIQRKMDADGTVKCLEAAIELLDELDDFSHDNQYAEFKKLAKELGVKNGQLFGSVRVAVTGQRVSPPTFETMEILGAEESIRRCRLAIDNVQATVTE